MPHVGRVGSVPGAFQRVKRAAECNGNFLKEGNNALITVGQVRTDVGHDSGSQAKDKIWPRGPKIGTDTKAQNRVFFVPDIWAEFPGS